MKKYLLLITYFFSLFTYSSGQNPLVKQWDKRFGGTNDEFLTTIQQTNDGGYILGGFSFSGSGGDKTQPSWGYNDYWIVKTDSLGNKLWDKRFGGTSFEALLSLQQTRDDGYILGGYSNSGISGDKTQANWNVDSADYWIVKIDPSGNKLWDKRFGGTNDDYLYSIRQTTDGGYILGGYSNSGVSGDKTQPGWGYVDYWIVKIDSLGNKLWDKRFGGADNDWLASVQQTSDGGYILGGDSDSGISGDKTQPTWGYNDYWIVKTDALGNKLWDKRFGGTSLEAFRSLQQTTDGGYILGGISLSGLGGDKSQSSWGGFDYWIVKTDSLGNKLWDKRFGGTGDDDGFGNISQTTDGGYLLPGTSYSPVSGDKTENNLGTEQTWIVKTDSLGNVQWDKTLFTATPIHDESGFGIQSSDGCYVFANNTLADTGGYKTQPNWDTTKTTGDYWIIKFCDTTLTTSLAMVNGQSSMVNVSPNPFTSDITITIQKQYIYKASFTIKNILGQTVYTFSNPDSYRDGKGSSTLDLNFLSNGIYIVDATIYDERIVKKIVKE